MRSSLSFHNALEASSPNTVLVEMASQTVLHPYEDALRGNTIVLFDGFCVFCNRVVRLLLVHGRSAPFRFVPLASPLARALLARHPALPQTAEQAQSVIVMLDALTPAESVHQRSDAVLVGMRLLPTPWPFIAAALLLIPRSMRDFSYRLIACIRYRLFGRYAACPIPIPSDRMRILGVETT